MYLAYFDESGDSGMPPKSPTKFFILACVLIPADQWASSLDSLVALRRRLRESYGIPVRPELKATDFVRGFGAFAGLHTSRRQRMDIYRECLQYVVKMPHVRIFGVAINKTLAGRRGWEAREAAWRFAFQRVDRFCEAEDDLSLVFPDEGHTSLVRPLLRRLRRFQRVRGAYGGIRDIKVERVIEDPNERQSQLSYFVQVADWAAYAAHRSSYLDPRKTVPDDLWDELDPCLLKAVTKVKGGAAPAIVLYP